MKILIEQDIVPEMGISLHLLFPIENRTAHRIVSEKNAGQPAGQLSGDFAERQVSPGAGRALNGEIVSVILMKFLERFDEEVVYRYPNGSAPKLEFPPKTPESDSAG